MNKSKNQTQSIAQKSIMTHVLHAGLPPFVGAKTGQKNIRVHLLISLKYIFIPF
jgi:hypothetical protein